jgi:hypothetical protein
MKNFILATVFIFAWPLTSIARPKAVVLLRHAEEPKDDSSNHLSETGYTRAKLLPKLFKTHPVLKNLGTPVALFGAGAKNKDSSIRSIETLAPLSLDLEIPINDSFKRDDFRALSENINTNPAYEGQVVVVVWQHKILTEIAEKIGLKKPPTYPSGHFDRIWIVTYGVEKKGDKAVLQDLPQQLLPGDSKK